MTPEKGAPFQFKQFSMKIPSGRLSLDKKGSRIAIEQFSRLVCAIGVRRTLQVTGISPAAVSAFHRNPRGRHHLIRGYRGDFIKTELPGVRNPAIGPAVQAWRAANDDKGGVGLQVVDA
jgi:hypothetical protein